MNCNKNSFTLFEVLISLVILSVVLLNINNIFLFSDTTQTYIELVEQENQFVQNGSVSDTSNLKFK